MGLFGREDKSSTPSAAGPTATARPTDAESTVTLIARASRFKGTLSGSADVKVAGALEGEVEASGNLVISESGTVKARLHARTVVVAGSVEGDVTADDKIELQPSARLRGNITAPRILIEEGATFEGQVFMKSPEKRTAPGQPAAAAPTSPHDKPPEGAGKEPGHRGKR